MAKVIARRSGVHKSESTSISFKKDLERGLYKKIEHDIRSNHLEHTTKKSGKPRVSEEWYELGDESNWDYMFEVSGPGNNLLTVYFRKFSEDI